MELVEVKVQETIVLDRAVKEVIEVIDGGIVVVDAPEGGMLVFDVPTMTILSEGIQGPPGYSEDEVALAKRVDFVTDSLIYKGQAQPGATDASPVWRISRITMQGDGDAIEEWAGGNAAFDKVWTNRASLSYS